MEQPWIHKAKTDSVFILLPPFLVLAVVVLFQDWLAGIQEDYSFYTWLFLIVFIDVAHVYSTLFKTYFNPKTFEQQKRLFLGLPLLCLLIGIVLFSFGSKVFWSVLAYVAVFHFIRQQYGFMRLYSRKEPRTQLNRSIDSLVIYAATGYPMLYWFLSSPRKFNWFMEDEFFRFENQTVLKILGVCYFLIMLFYVIRTVILSVRQKFFNVPKNAIIAGTALSWYFGIVYFNNDLIFTLLNVVSHGIPYMALIYLKEIESEPSRNYGVFTYLKRFQGVVIFVLILTVIAFFEEYLWEILVWNEHFSINAADFSNWHVLLVPLLTVPQFTHYLLDGFIWKSK
ncbi:hypothetical protein LZZ90_00975 [Flavobacterium sp. SM15]|uniref:hypothetical protein n=1 Tax=Flavobacterium sp. SM15 TaxID=2908005 RepID=UPI001EDA63A7|nr:hypothetical protein [Flavobacterium sp. SM15]MCG2610073.1 hypothetical protein [Flavobacterium sp. SM15]